jgi:hypothetical protein
MDHPAQRTTPTGSDPGRRDVLAADLWKSDSTDATDATPSASQAQLLRPRVGTVSANILTVLESGQGLTAGTAWRNYGCARLAAVVCDLRRMGWPILAVTVEVKCADGRTAHVASYSMGRVAP